MKTFTIAEVKENMVGMVIPRMELIVGAVYKRKTGNGQYGEWSLQNAAATDSSGQEIKLVFKQYPDQKALSGRKLVFKSMEGRNGLNGLAAKLNEYKGKETVELHVTKSALIVSAGEEPNVELATTSIRIPQNEPTMTQEAPIKHDDRKLNIATARNRMTQLAGLYDLCWKTVDGMEASKDIGGLYELKKDIATTLFIQSVREGLADKMPVRTLEKFYCEKETEKKDMHESDQPF